MSCPTPEELMARVVAGENVPHLEECADCAWYIKVVYYAAKAFGGDQAALERALAEELDEALAGVASRHWASQLVNQRRFHHAIVVQEILRRADREYENAAVVGDLTTAAVGLCDALVKDGVPPPRQLFFDALKEHAMALRAAGNLTGSLDALARASTITPEMENREQLDAVLSLCTALTYSEADLGKFDEAIALAERAEGVLDRCGDRRRALMARQTKAYALMAMERFGEALDIALRVAKDLEEIGRPLDVAIAHHLVANCCVGVGQYEKALHHAAAAKEGYKVVGNLTGEARVSHEAARALAATGHFGEARPEFDRTSEVVFAARLFEQWAIFRLDYIAAALHDDAGADVRGDVQAVARVCLMLGGEESTLRRRYAAEAVDYLRRLAVRDALTVEAADHVRDFVWLNTSRPPVRFTPPNGGEFVM